MEQISKSSRDLRQEQGVRALIKAKGKGCLVQPTGTGKTVTALKSLKTIIDKKPDVKFIVIVPTDNLKDQWELNIRNWGFSLNGEAVVVNTAVKNTYTTDILVIDKKLSI